MRTLTLNVIVLSAVALLTTSCLHASAADDEKILGLAAALTKVSSAVNTTVRYKNPPADLHDGPLLAFATAHNPSLLKAFDGYVLKARQSGKNSSVLICDAQGQTALIEDAGCTAKSDLNIQQTHPGQPCDYVLDLAVTCAIP